MIAVSAFAAGSALEKQPVSVLQDQPAATTHSRGQLRGGSRWFAQMLQDQAGADLIRVRRAAGRPKDLRRAAELELLA